MSVEQMSVAAATAVLDYDLMDDAPASVRSAPYDRRLVAAGLAGSAAALDTKIELKIGVGSVGNMYNSSLAAPNRDDMFRLGEFVPANTPIQAIVRDAPATNPINLALDLVGQ